jgi:lipid-A-disaccharide synthase
MAGAVERIRVAVPGVRVWMVLPHERLVAVAAQATTLEVLHDWDQSLLDAPDSGKVRTSIGRLPELLGAADLALASSGTVTMECAWFRVPTVVMYKVAWPTYWVARQMVKVPFIAMPNLLAGERLYPEFVQSAATVEVVAREALDLLQDVTHRDRVVAGLDRVIASLGEPGACRRAAEAVAALLGACG